MSWQMRSLAAAITLVRKVRPASEARAQRRLAAPKKSPAPPAWLTQRFDVTTRNVDGFDVHTVSPAGSDHCATVIFLHGGGYVAEIEKSHWTLVADFASGLGVDVVVPIYGLAPQHCAAEAVPLVHNVIRDSSASGPVYLAGDSAGGGLALAATMSWIEQGGTPPVGLTLIAPWLDIALRNPELPDVQRRDPFGFAGPMRVVGRAWAREMWPDDPQVSPLFYDLTSVPPIDLYVGDRDITSPDCRALRDKAPAGRVSYHEQPGALHVYPLLPVPEGRRARKDMVAHAKTAMAKV